MAADIKTSTGIFIAKKSVNSTCDIAHFDVGAFYLPCTLTIMDSTRMSSIFLLQGARVIRDEIAMVSLMKCSAWRNLYQTQYKSSEKNG